MPLFQSAVLNKYLKQQDDAAIRAAYARFRQHFHAPEIQANIRNSKEEQYQEGFLRDLFVDILGYTLNPQPGFQLTTEFKNEKGSKKADGAILQQGKALAVIELKGPIWRKCSRAWVRAGSLVPNEILFSGAGQGLRSL